MNLENGLYAVTFMTPLGQGTGVAYLADGKLRGGDSMMAYVGSYSQSGGQAQATVRSYKFAEVPNMASVFGVDEVDIQLKGSVTATSAIFEGTSPQAPGIRLSVEMNRLHD